MIKFKAETEGDFLIFSDLENGIKTGGSISFRKQLTKGVNVLSDSDYLTIISIDNNSSSYNYKEVVDENDAVFATVTSFRTYIILKLST